MSRVVGGIETLKVMERVPTDEDDVPEEEIKILSTTVFADPFEEVNELLVKEQKEEEEKAQPAAVKPSAAVSSACMGRD